MAALIEPQTCGQAIWLFILVLSSSLTFAQNQTGTEKQHHSPAVMDRWNVATQPSGNQGETGKHVEFAVASVKLSDATAPLRGVEYLSPFGPPFTGGLFSANAPLIMYIVFAYNLTDHSQYPELQKSLPKWAQNDHFDIEARTREGTSRSELREMMQTLLNDRFRLSGHSQSKDVPTYALMLKTPSMLGPQLIVQPSTASCEVASQTNPEGPSTPKQSNASKGHTSHCGLNQWLTDTGLIHMHFVSISMDTFIAYVAGASTVNGGLESRPVIDKTGIKDRVDIDLEFGASVDPSAPFSTSGGGPTFSTALQRQLGLVLVKQHDAVSAFVIDQIEQPVAN